MTQILVKLILSYKKFISPIAKQLLGVKSFCKYPQVCSDYAITVIKKYGVLRGVLLAIRRVLSCNPFGELFLSIKPLKNLLKTENFKLKIN